MSSHFIAETNAEYHSRPEISASKIKTMNEGWRWWEGCEITRTIKRSESPSMKLGTAIHAAILEPEQFQRDYIVCPADCSDRRTKKHKEWAEGVGASQVVLSADEAATVLACVTAAMRHKAAAGIIAASPTVEKSFLFTDPESGVPCRTRFDILSGQVVCDIKTTARLSDGDFAKAVQDYRYDIQAAHYLEGFAAIGMPGLVFVFLVLETAAPHRCRVYQLGDEELEIGRDRRSSLLGEYVARESAGDWSDPGENELQTVRFSNYFLKRESER
jgi:hypothetical protein